MARCTRDKCCILPCRRGEERSERNKPKATPLPWKKLLVICAVLFVNQFGMAMIFPFLPFMIHDFFPYLDKTELGHKAGYLGSAYFVGNFVGSLLWGWVSDRVGRRPVLLVGMCGTIASEILFGLSQNFAWAVLGRLMWGLLNGNIGVAKTYISEVCDDTNQARGFSFIGTTGGVGRLMGSVIGGFLAQPASKYSALQFPFFCKYPYILPCLVGAGMSIGSLIASWLFLDETLDKKKKKNNKKKEAKEERSDTSDEGAGKDVEERLELSSSGDSGVELLMMSQEDLDDSDTEMIDLTPSETDTDTEQLIMAESDIDTESDFDTVTSDTELLIRERDETEDTNAQTAPRRTFKDYCNPLASLAKMKRSLLNCFSSLAACVTCIASYDYRMKCTPRNARSVAATKLKQSRQSLKRTVWLLYDRRVALSISLYATFAFFSIVSRELLPLLMVTNHEHGGYNMDDNEIGVLLMVVAITQLLWQLTVYPRIVKCLGYRRTFQLGIIVYGVSCILLPFSNRITGPIVTDSDGGSASGSGSGLLSVVLNTTDLDYCGNNISSSSTDTLINENSVKRIPAQVWVVLGLITVMRVIASVMAMTSTMVLIGNSSLPETRGTVNGFAQSLAAIGRMLGPMVGAPIFAWSESTGKGWPLNYHFMFDLVAVSSLVAVVISLFLPKTIEKKRDTLERETRT